MGDIFWLVKRTQIETSMFLFFPILPYTQYIYNK